MTAAERLDTGAVFVSNSFTGYSTSGSSNGDDPFLCFHDGSVSQTFFAGTSRRVQSVKDVVAAVAMVACVLALGMIVTWSIEQRIEGKPMSEVSDVYVVPTIR